MPSLEAKEPTSLGVADALGLFEAGMAEQSEQTSDAFEPVYENIKAKLFTRKTEVALDRGKRETILKVKALKDKLPNKRDYLEDLLYVLKELDALPDRYSRFIRSIDLKTLEEDFELLKRQCPHSYLVSIIEREKKIEEGEESLILSEELI